MKEGMTMKLPDGVEMTALAMALERDLERKQPKPLFEDRLAERFIQAAEEEMEGSAEELDGFRKNSRLSARWPALSGWVALRTWFFDQHLKSAVARGCEQVVLLAAGLDSRAFRLDLPPSVLVLEIDFPSLLDFKESVVAADGTTPTCARRVIRSDVRDDWIAQVNEAGFDPNRSTCWIIEGLMLYLRPEQNDDLLTRVSTLSSSGSSLAFDHVSKERHANRAMAGMARVMDRMGISSWNSWLDDPVGWVALHGWDARIADPVTVAADANRPVPEVMDSRIVGEARAWWVEATRT